MSLNQLIAEAKLLSNEAKIPEYERFLQVFPGGYGEGDIVWAIRIPLLRTLAKKYVNISLDDVFTLLKNKVHDLRMLAVFILEYKLAPKKTSNENREQIANRYLQHLTYINNWDLVDASCIKILGSYVYNKSKPQILLNLADSNNFWENRIAIVSTFYHIRKNEFKLSIDIATKLLYHKHDLIHKGVGWMLREIGNRDQMVELDFLAKHYKSMPRTMLRYAIEKFDEALRQQFLKGVF